MQEHRTRPSLPPRFSIPRLPIHPYNGPFPCPSSSAGVCPLPTSESALRCAAVGLLAMHRRGRAMRGAAEHIVTRGHAAKHCTVSRDTDCRKRAGEGAGRTTYGTEESGDSSSGSIDSIVHVCTASGQHAVGWHHAVVSGTVGRSSAGTMRRGRHSATVRP